MTGFIGSRQPSPPNFSRQTGTSPRRAIAIVTMAFVVAGVFVGAWWAWIAPSIHAVIALTRNGERVHDYLGNESQDFFIAPCMMLGLLTVLATVSSVLAWHWREKRGPAMLLGLTAGSVVGAAVASGVGALLVRLRYGALNFDAIPLSNEHKIAYVVEAPPVFFDQTALQTAVTLFWPAAIAALVYAVFAGASARDDLGASPLPRIGPQPTVPGTPVA